MPFGGEMVVLNTELADEWRAVLEEIGLYDFYHLPMFHKLFELRGAGKAMMPVYREGGYTIAFPLLIRPLDELGPAVTRFGYKDATSVPGFAGPVASTADVPEAVQRRFIEALQVFFERNRVLSVFSRFNPVMNQAHLLNGYGHVVERGVTLAIDLTVPSEEQFARYRKHFRKEIRQLARSGLVCREVGHEYLDEFLQAYRETMDRTNAQAFYRFDRAYVEFLMREMSDVVHMFACMDGSKVTCAALCAACGGIVEIYLSGTYSAYLERSPSKLLHDAIRQWANHIGARVVHMGGGVEAKRDSLHHFKMGFGAQEYTYFTWRHVVDDSIYDELCREAYAGTGRKPDEYYFPAYRHPDLQGAKGL